MFFHSQTKEASIDRAQKREENKLKKDLVTMLAALPVEQWQWEDPAKKHNFPFYLTRTVLKTTTANGASAKLIRDVVKTDVTTADRDKHNINYLRKYELYIDRIYMSSERHNSDPPAAGSIGMLFETIEAKIKG